MTHQDYFIPGSPLIICAFESQPIGSFASAIGGDVVLALEDANAPHYIKRQVTAEEYYATMRPEFREQVKALADPDALFYEVSVD